MFICIDLWQELELRSLCSCNCQRLNYEPENNQQAQPNREAHMCVGRYFFASQTVRCIRAFRR